MSEFRLLIKFPTRERPRQFFEVLNAAQRNREHETTKFLITLDANDPLMNHDNVRKTMEMWGNLQYEYGVSISKINAINRDMYKAQDYDIILLLSDDMIPEAKGYDKIICDLFQKHFPDTDGVLWLNDGYVGTKMNTSVCMGKKYYERFNYLYNNFYKSLFADNEFTDVSLILNKVQYVNDVLIRHRHPMNTGGQLDNLYRKNDRFFQSDKSTYEKRKAINFNLPESSLLNKVA